MTNKLRLIYITTKDRDEAATIGGELVKRKLAACANIINGMESVYWWEGKIETDKECILIAKTTQNNVQKITGLVKELHSYDVPCVISINLEENEGHPEYLKWLSDSVN
ncbi:MAG: divalent-cation tolerance protein CutA [Balneolaceae bacterium]